MPIIRVDMFPGRSETKKSELVERLTETYLDVIGGSPGGVTILLNEVSQDHWAVAGQLVSHRQKHQDQQ